ncbi:lipoyl domain-containing protein [Salinibacterium sp. ZJ450]|uniref:lipoyl domain-containing protein n=1 Tax=Salinibacterium sp. ZJ450 TaxID=2708338 RepID=UPI001423A1F5|nr:lipoyl domain-containing protein [Salinibacterium sp. ZJ450]
MDVMITKDVLGEETEGDLTEWLVADGDQVTAGQAIAQIETAKVMLDIEAPSAGKITLLVDSGDVFELGATIASIA